MLAYRSCNLRRLLEGMVLETLETLWMLVDEPLHLLDCPVGKSSGLRLYSAYHLFTYKTLKRVFVSYRAEQRRSVRLGHPAQLTHDTSRGVCSLHAVQGISVVPIFLRCRDRHMLLVLIHVGFVELVAACPPHTHLIYVN